MAPHNIYTAHHTYLGGYGELLLEPVRFVGELLVEQLYTFLATTFILFGLALDFSLPDFERLLLILHLSFTFREFTLTTSGFALPPRFFLFRSWLTVHSTNGSDQHLKDFGHIPGRLGTMRAGERRNV
jgi:hypothetical protein